ncbi:MAG: hypothetical protein K6C08_14555 [Oscillospiraceae bacterium]|nr:hypothetical protein [Oscillospiraceae bacterium]
MGREKVKFYVNQESFGVHACVILMGLSAAFRIVGGWGLWNDRLYAATQILLPVVSALLFAVCIRFFGKSALWMSFVPLALGVVFFVVRALGSDSVLHTVLYILLALAVLVLYFCTVFGILKTKWLLVPLFGLPFLYRIFVTDLPALSNTDAPVTFAAGMQEMSVLCIMLGLFFLAIAMKKLVKEPEQTLPRMKPPKIIKKPAQMPEREEGEEQPKKESAAETAAADGETAEKETDT